MIKSIQTSNTQKVDVSVKAVKWATYL